MSIRTSPPRHSSYCLFDEFVLAAQAITERSEIFNTINDWLGMVQNYNNMDLAASDTSLLSHDMEVELKRTLRSEQETWQLILDLYLYRLSTNMDQDSEDQDMDIQTRDSIDPLNEAVGIQLIEEKDKSIKELCIILEWLEQNYRNQSEPDFTEKFINWEHTLGALKKNKLFGNYTSDKPMVTVIDPDACHRQGKDVHAYDKPDDLKVQKGAYFYIRSGQVKKALDYLYESGYVAQAAMLRGFYPTRKTPRDENTMVESGDKFFITGNLERDMWKNVSFSICESNAPPMYERASIGALCGHRKSLLDVSLTWEDRLYAYLHTLKDVRVEAELRRKSAATVIRMPEEYWAQECTIADSVKACTQNVAAIPTYKKIFCLIQKHVILDTIDNLLDVLSEEVSAIKEEELHSPIIGQQLRFLTHMLIAFGLVDLPYKEELLNTCAEAYIRVLVKSQKFIYIPYYVNKLSEHRQIPLIAELVDPENKFEMQDIEYFLKAAKANDLDILRLGVAIVEKLNSAQDDFDVKGLLWIRYCYELLQDPIVTVALIRTTLRVLRKYLILNRISKAKEIMSQISSNDLREVSNFSIQCGDTIVREFLCYQIYIEAENAFTMWQKSLSQKPERYLGEDQRMDDGMSVSDQAFYDRKRAEYSAAEEKWQRATNHHLETCIEKFLAVLKFPNGWLVDSVSRTDHEDFNQVNNVRRMLIPKVVFILLKLIKEHNSISELKEFLYIICEDDYQVLKEFKPNEIASIFQGIEEMIRSATNVLSQIPK